MCGIERWDGPLALLILFGRQPGPLAQAGMAAGLWPYRLASLTRNPPAALAGATSSRGGAGRGGGADGFGACAAPPLRGQNPTRPRPRLGDGDLSFLM